MTPPIKWRPEAAPEKFGILEIKFECPLGSEPRQAWIYLPQNSPHRHNLFGIEIIAEDLKGSAPEGAHCRIHIEKGLKQSSVTII